MWRTIVINIDYMVQGIHCCLSHSLFLLNISVIKWRRLRRRLLWLRRLLAVIKRFDKSKCKFTWRFFQEASQPVSPIAVVHVVSWQRRWIRRIFCSVSVVRQKYLRHTIVHFDDSRFIRPNRRIGVKTTANNKLSLTIIWTVVNGWVKCD